MGSARDIVEHCGVPRFVFSDFPLGNSAGKPHDPVSQYQTLLLALELFEQARAPRTTTHSPQRWNEHDAWKAEFHSIEHLNAEELAQRRAEFDQIKAVGNQVREDASR